MEQSIAESVIPHPRANDILVRLQGVETVRTNLSQQLTHSYVLLVVAKGKGTLYLNERESGVHQNSFMICAPEHTFGAQSAEDEGMELLLFRFDVFLENRESQEILESFKDENLFTKHGQSSGYWNNSLTLQCEEIYRKWCSAETFGRFRSRIDFQELLYSILTSSRLFKKSSLSSLERSKQYIEQHYSENLTIERLAGIAGLSPKYFVDLFKKTYGKSAMEYAAELKMNAAKLLMARGNLTLKEIARQIGFEDEFYFSRKFKKEVGVTPTAYRISRRRKIAVYNRSVCGHVLALHIMPYAAPLHPKWTEYYYQAYRKDIPVHLSAYRHNADWESNIELLARSGADTVLCTDAANEREIRMLKDKVPGLFMLREDVHWRDQFKRIADYLGEAGEAERWLHSYDRKVEQARKRLRQWIGGSNLLIVRMLKNKLYIHSNRGIASALFEDLRLTSAAGPVPADYNREVSIDQLSAIHPDHLLLLICQETETLACWERLQTTPEWQALEAVRNRRTYSLASDPWREYSAYAQSRMIDRALELFSVNRP